MQPSATAEPERTRPAKQSRANGGKSPPWSQLSLRSVLLIALQSEVATGNPHPRVERQGFLRKVIPTKITKPHSGDKPPDFARHILHKYYTIKFTEIL